MKRLFILFPLFCVNVTIAQINIDCATGRFDQEVFTTINVHSNVQYGLNFDAYGVSTNLTMDIYEPDGDTMQQRPLIIWAHGGSFISGTKNDVDVSQLSEHFAKRGYVCASIKYRLGIPFPIDQVNAMRAVYRAVQDMKAAVRFFRQDAATTDQYKIDPSTIFAGGSSAGAFTALHLAYMDSYDELPVQIDTSLLGDLEGNSGNAGYSSEVNAVINLCGALGDKLWIKPTDVPFVSMHGPADATVPYGTAMINILGAFPVMVVDGSFSIAEHANTINLTNEMYTYKNAGHVPYVANAYYMDTTVRFVSNFLYRILGCIPSDPEPVANTFTNSTIDEIGNNTISVHPNPTSGKIWIKDRLHRRKFEVTVNSISGKMVFSGSVENSQLNLEHIEPGIYFISITSGNEKTVSKIVFD